MIAPDKLSNLLFVMQPVARPTFTTTGSTTRPSMGTGLEGRIEISWASVPAADGVDGGAWTRSEPV
ncbi:MAG: hypothetical protein IPH71_16235 [Proteobacteria bacterium]|nr:hypothetical protein [Pseudomonadota bacterium]